MATDNSEGISAHWKSGVISVDKRTISMGTAHFTRNTAKPDQLPAVPDIPNLWRTATQPVGTTRRKSVCAYWG